MPEYLHPGVYVQEESSGAKPIEGASTSTACFVGRTTRGQPNRPTFVTTWAQFERAFGGLRKEYPMPLAVNQFFQNGGRRTYILRVLPRSAVKASTQVTIDGYNGPVDVQAIGGGKWGGDIRIKVRVNQFSHLTGKDEDTRPYLYDWLVLVKNQDGTYDEVESHEGVGGLESGDRFYATIINRDSAYIRIASDKDGKFSEVSRGTEKTPKTGDVLIPWKGDDKQNPPVPEPKPHDLQNGDDGNAAGPTPGDYGSSLLELNRIDDASILLIPGEVSAVGEGIAYVEGRRLGDMFYVVDPPDPKETEPSKQIEDVQTFVKEKITVKSSYAALYFPWVEVPDPYSTVMGATRKAPPSGMIAGLYARTDNTRGVWKAPAGTEAVLLGTVGLAAKVSDSEQDMLNPVGINCIRQFPASGIVVWGSRTLATSSNPEYRYVPIRRMTNFLKASLFRGTQWVVFEPNDEPLWSAIRFNLNAFMMTQFRSGAFQGGKPSEAFIVKCDADNNIQATIDAGQIHILVAFAPLKPAEFVIIHIQQIRKQ